MPKPLRDLLLLLAVLLPTELWLYAGWDLLLGPTQRAYLAEMARPTPAARVLVVGDSHPHNAWQAGPLPDSVADVSFGSESLRDVHLKLRTLLRRGVRPHTLVVAADDHVFARYREHTNNELALVLVPDVTAADYNAVYGRTLSPLTKPVMAALPLLDVRRRSLLITLLIEHYRLRASGARRAPGTGGAAPDNLKPKPSWATHLPAKRRHLTHERLATQVGARFESSALLQTTWADLLTLCRAHAIRVVAVRYPVSDEYRAGLARFDRRAVAATLRACPPDTLLDYQALYAGRADFFQDADHLNRAGSARFVPHLLTALRGLPPPK